MLWPHLWREARVQLECAYGADDDCASGAEARVEALDVEELLAAHVGAETGLRHEDGRRGEG